MLYRAFTQTPSIAVSDIHVCGVWVHRLSYDDRVRIYLQNVRGGSSEDLYVVKVVALELFLRHS